MVTKWFVDSKSDTLNETGVKFLSWTKDSLIQTFTQWLREEQNLSHGERFADLNTDTLNEIGANLFHEQKIPLSHWNVEEFPEFFS